MHQINSAMQWPHWTACVLQQNARGELEGDESSLFHAFKSRAFRKSPAGKAEPMSPGSFLPQLSEPSHIVSDNHVRALAGGLLM